MNSTISGNSAGTSGSGIYNVGLPLHAANSTISGNSAGTSGGGIFNFAGLVEIANCTVSGNSASSGGGIYNSAAQFGAVLQTANTIFNAGASGENIFNDGGTVISDGYNLSSDAFHDQRGPCYYRAFGRSRRIDIGSVETQPERPCPAPRPRPTPP